MKIAILQPTPFRKGHYYIYTKSLFDELINLGQRVKIISSGKIYDQLNNEKYSKLNFNIYSFNGLIIYFALCFSATIRFIFKRNYFNRLIILDCEYSCVSLLLFILKLLNWKGKITLQVNAPNFKYDFKKDGLNIFKILKFIQSLIFKYSLNLFDLKISCLGKWHKKELSKQLNFSAKRIIIIEDGGGEIINKIPDKELFSKLFKASIFFPKDNKKIFLLFGNFRKDKGHIFLSRIWNKYFNCPDDPYLWIVGHDEEKITPLILKNNSKNIFVHNSYIPLNLISCIYQKTDYAILPYLATYKGGSGPLMKGAFTHSKLALVANVSEMGRIAKEEKLAVSFIAEDELSVVSSIKLVLKKSPEYYSEKIKSACDYANERDWSNLSKRFIKSLE